MKKLYLVALAVLLGVAVAAQCMGQGHEPTPGIKDEGAAGAAKPPMMIRVKAGGGAAFQGVVTAIDARTRVISVRGKGKTISFDASNPVFKGFRRLEDVKAGNFVAIAYTAKGIRITRTSGKGAGPGELREPARIAGKEPGPRETGKRVAKRERSQGREGPGERLWLPGRGREQGREGDAR